MKNSFLKRLQPKIWLIINVQNHIIKQFQSETKQLKNY
jgi:hypothetical protein